MSTSPRFHIRRVRLRHYRSIASCDVRLGPLTLLVGPNGSGKSNFVDSLRFVAQALGENLDNALRDRGGAAEVRRRSTGHPTHFGVQLDVEIGSTSVATYGFQIGAVSGGDFRVTHESVSMRQAAFGSPDAHVEVRDGVVVSSSFTVLPRPVEDRLFLVALSGMDEFRPLFDGLAGIGVYNLNPDAMRQPGKPDPGDLLSRDGANIASVVESLRRNRPERKTEIEEYLRRIVPGIESVDRKAIGAWETLEFRQLIEGADHPWTFQASSMSDGTLRACGVLVALYAAPAGIAGPVAIEEPETALHPAATGLLLDALRGAAEFRQVLATSHSPDLLDSPTIPPDAVLAVRAHGGRTIVARPDLAAREALAEQLFTPGELLRVDQLQPEPAPTQMELFP